MPNHVANLITGPSLDQIRELLKSPESLVDFNKLIPMPEILSKTVSGVRKFDGDTEITRTWICENPDAPYKDQINRKLTAEEKDQTEEIGFDNWYDWAVENWGTKWNAYDVADRGEGGLYFETAWSFPEPILDEIIKRLPDADFSWKYADEDYGNNLGICVYKDRLLMRGEPSENAHEWAMRLHGHTDETIAQRRREIEEDAAETTEAQG